ncbi:MAG TPA: hypothetical protein HPP81_03355 [Deltaproteobacteria bacterium]|jgi:hypothetical protein|nr:hypothetical protein [Deltaproteobacteria bacterium]
MKWYYWVPICWISVNVFVVALPLVGRLLVARQAARKSTRSIMAGSSVVGDN